MTNKQKFEAGQAFNLNDTKYKLMSDPHGRENIGQLENGVWVIKLLIDVVSEKAVYVESFIYSTPILWGLPFSIMTFTDHD